MPSLFDDKEQFSGAEPEAKPIPGAVTPKYNGPKEFGGTGEVSLPKGSDTSLGSTPSELFLAGMGMIPGHLKQGIEDKAALLFRPNGAAGDKVLSDINARRAEQERIDAMLLQNPAAVAGNTVGNIALGAAAPARLGAQVALQGGLGFLNPGRSGVTGMPSELASSALHGAEDAGTTWLMGQGAKLLGHTGAAATGDLTPKGKIAMRTNAAAERLGMPTPTIGQLSPGSALSKIDDALPDFASRLEGQTDAMRKATSSTLKLSDADIDQLGGQFKNELTDAVKKRYALARGKYQAVDDYLSTNNLQGISPSYTANVLTSNSPGRASAMDELKYYGIQDADKIPSLSAAQIRSRPMQFTDYNDFRVATNKAWSNTTRQITTMQRVGNPVPADLFARQKYLTELKTALDNDAARWSKLNEGNGAAFKLFQDANNYWRSDVAPTVLENPLAGKLMSKRAGFATPRDALTASTSSAGMPKLDLLRPTMSQRGEDMTQILQQMPDVRAALLQDKSAVPSSGESLAKGLVAIGAGASHPASTMEALLAHIPGTEALLNSKLAKNLYFSNNPLEGGLPAMKFDPATGARNSWRSQNLPYQGLLPRAAYGALSYLRPDVERYGEGVLGSRQ